MGLGAFALPAVFQRFFGQQKDKKSYGKGAAADHQNRVKRKVLAIHHPQCPQRTAAGQNHGDNTDYPEEFGHVSVVFLIGFVLRFCGIVSNGFAGI